MVELSGTVFNDEDGDCIFSSPESGIEGIELKAVNAQNGQSYYTFTNADGTYTTNFWAAPDQESITIQTSLPNILNTLLPCGSSHTQTFDLNPDTNEFEMDFPMVLDSDCPLVYADIATDQLRPCLWSTYTVSYCNYSELLVEDAVMVVTLDPFLEVTYTSIPFSNVSGNTYTFELGDLDPGFCDEFYIEVFVDCEVEVGATLCVHATLFPHQLCDEVDPDYSGASLWAESECLGNEVKFTITNIGDADMVDVAEYIIVEDVIMYMAVPFQLNAGEKVDILLPANGSTWRMEAPNEVLYPGQYQPIAWMERCGGMNTAGLVNLFPTNVNEPYRSTFCMEVVNSFDPNDKQGFPLGFQRCQLYSIQYGNRLSDPLSEHGHRSGAECFYPRYLR